MLSTLKSIRTDKTKKEIAPKTKCGTTTLGGGAFLLATPTII